MSSKPPRDKRSTETLNLTILLADMRRFSGLTHSYPAESVVSLINQYCVVMEDIVVKHGGIINKITGDTIMALFGLESSQPDDVERAITCAVNMQQVMPAINHYSQQLGMPAIYVGIALNTGTVVAGNIGAKKEHHYTVIGEEVNLASHVVTHSLRGQILLTQNTFEQAQSFIKIHLAQQVYFKERREPITLYHLKETLRPQRLIVPQCEERNGPRVNVSIPLAFNRISGSTIMPDVHQGEILNLSYNGMKARLPIYLEPYSNIKFPLAVAQANSAFNNIYAKVLRSNMHKEDYTSSLEFTDVAPTGQTALRAYVDRLVA